MDEYKLVQKYFDKNKNNNSNKTQINKHFIAEIVNKTLLSGVMLLVCLCVVRVNSNFKDWINKNVYHTNFSFAKYDKLYKQYFGNIFPISNLNPDTSLVFDEKLTYKSSEAYKEGVKLVVGDNYLVPVLESGIIVFSGNKDNYGNTVIIQQVNGIDLWYVGVENSNYKIYDYVEKGQLLGESINSEIYLYYQKAGEFLDYKEYLG